MIDGIQKQLILEEIYSPESKLRSYQKGLAELAVIRNYAENYKEAIAWAFAVLNRQRTIIKLG